MAWSNELLFHMLVSEELPSTTSWSFYQKRDFSQQDIECNQTTVTQKWFLHHSWNERQIVKSPYSLAMSPIEYLWDLVKRLIHTQDSPHINITNVWIAIEMARIKISLYILINCEIKATFFLLFDDLSVSNKQNTHHHFHTSSRIISLPMMSMLTKTSSGT